MPLNSTTTHTNQLKIRAICAALLSAISCQSKTSANLTERTQEQSEVAFDFEVENKTLSLNYIQNGCALINSGQKLPEDFSYTDFFHNYLQFKSSKPEYLKYFSCTKKLKNEGMYVMDLDREPSYDVDYQKINYTQTANNILLYFFITITN